MDLFGDEEVSGDANDIGVSNPYETEENPYQNQPSENNTTQHETSNNAENNGDLFGDVELPNKEQKQSEDQEPTVLSVWLESRRQILEERRTKEREEEDKLQKQAKDDIQKFLEDRQRRMDEARKQNRTKEKQLREDLESVFQYGTHWEQVARMVNLQEPTDNRGLSGDQERMRNLLIQLKNEKKPTDSKK